MPRLLPPPWRAEKSSFGYVVRDANGQALAYIPSRAAETAAVQAGVLTDDEARVVARLHRAASTAIEAVDMTASDRPPFACLADSGTLGLGRGSFLTTGVPPFSPRRGCARLPTY